MGVDDLEDGFKPGNSTSFDGPQETFAREGDFPAMSTPKRVHGGPRYDPGSPIAPEPVQDFNILPRVANVPPWIRRPKDPTFRPRQIETKKFVDDGVNMSKINLRSASLLVEQGRYFKAVTDPNTEDLLNFIAANAQEKGMIINKKRRDLCACRRQRPLTTESK